MKKSLFNILAALLIILAGCSAGYETVSWPQTIQTMMKRYLLVRIGSGWGSAVDLGGGYALTARHVVYDDSVPEPTIILLSALAGFNTAFIIDNNPSLAQSLDIALLRWPVFNHKAVSFSDNIMIGEPVFWLQPLPGSLSNGQLEIVINTAFVNWLNDTSFTVTLPFLPSCSGSAIYNLKGEIVGIATGYYNYGHSPLYGIAIRSGVIGTLITTTNQ